MSETPYRSIAVAATFSPRFHQVLAEANRVRDRFGSRLSMIYVGKRDATTARKFADAIAKLRLPQDSVVVYEEGDPAGGILAGARKLSVELLPAPWRGNRSIASSSVTWRDGWFAKPHAR